ncbi:hypothetical protein B0H12DRAFT_1240621 [Mycena haematopus]|nr:hypothetical protein B0H12DRAFT_1240621 [Mycena haematopus]
MVNVVVIELQMTQGGYREDGRASKLKRDGALEMHTARDKYCPCLWPNDASNGFDTLVIRLSTSTRKYESRYDTPPHDARLEASLHAHHWRKEGSKTRAINLRRLATSDTRTVPAPSGSGNSTGVEALESIRGSLRAQNRYQRQHVLNRVLETQPMPGFETPSAFGNPSTSSGFFPSSYVGQFSESYRAELTSPPNLYPVQSQYRGQAQPIPQRPYGVPSPRPGSRPTIEHAIQNMQVLP